MRYARYPLHVAVHPRYRVEDGTHCIDVRLGTLEQLFDNRDPAPFRERDLDPDLVEYLLAAAEDVMPYGRVRVVFWFTALPAGDVAHAVRAHWEYEIERLDRRRRRQRRSGQIALLIGGTLLGGLLSLAQLADGIPAVREGLTILSWVVMWRPVEALIYDWLPVRRDRKLMVHLLEAAVDVRAGKGPPPPILSSGSASSPPSSP